MGAICVPRLQRWVETVAKQPRLCAARAWRNMVTADRMPQPPGPRSRACRKSVLFMSRQTSERERSGRSMDRRDCGGEGKKNERATRAGFEPTRAEPNRFRVCRLNHSAMTASWIALRADHHLLNRTIIMFSQQETKQVRDDQTNNSSTQCRLEAERTIRHRKTEKNTFAATKQNKHQPHTNQKLTNKQTNT